MNIYAAGETLFSVGNRSHLPWQAGMPALTIRPPASSMLAPSLSGGKAFAAGAMRDGIGIRNFKAALLQVVAEIED